jgi:NadR type nicotinamide-nucleotide adenylyltransferase
MENTKVIKIAIIGPESTGKSVLSEQLAQHFNTVFVPEYAREYFSDKAIEGHTLDDLTLIYQKQIQWEHEMIKRANKILFCDTNLISGKVWSDVVFKKAPSFILENIERTDHDLLLLCDVDLPWIPDEQRKNEYNRKQIMQMHLDELKKLNVKFELISGKGEARLKNAIAAIEKHFKK